MASLGSFLFLSLDGCFSFSLGSIYLRAQTVQNRGFIVFFATLALSLLALSNLPSSFPTSHHCKLQNDSKHKRCRSLLPSLSFPLAVGIFTRTDTKERGEIFSPLFFRAIENICSKITFTGPQLGQDHVDRWWATCFRRGISPAVYQQVPGSGIL